MTVRASWPTWVFLAVVLGLAGSAGALSAEIQDDDGILLGTGDEGEVPVALDADARSEPVRIAWSQPKLGVNGSQIVEGNRSQVEIGIQPTKVGTGVVGVEARQGNDTVQLRIRAASVPKLGIQISGVSEQPSRTAHLFANGDRTYRLHLQNHGPVDISTQLRFLTVNETIDLAAGETKILEDRYLEDHRSDLVGDQVEVLVGQTWTTPLKPEGGRYLLEVHVHNEPTIVPRIDARTEQKDSEQQLVGNVTLVPVGEGVGFSGQLSISPVGPPVPCAPQERRPLVSDDPGSVHRTLSIEWPCATDARITVTGTGSSGVTVRETETVSVDAPSPDLAAPPLIGPDERLPTRDGWTSILWPAPPVEVSGPELNADVFVDEDGTPAASGSFRLWLVRSNASVPVGEVDVGSDLQSVVAAAGPIALAVGLAPFTRFP